VIHRRDQRTAPIVLGTVLSTVSFGATMWIGAGIETGRDVAGFVLGLLLTMMLIMQTLARHVLRQQVRRLGAQRYQELTDQIAQSIELLNRQGRR